MNYSLALPGIACIQTVHRRFLKATLELETVFVIVKAASGYTSMAREQPSTDQFSGEESNQLQRTWMETTTTAVGRLTQTQNLPISTAVDNCFGRKMRALNETPTQRDVCVLFWGGG